MPGQRCLLGLTHTKFAEALISNDEIYQYALQNIPQGSDYCP
jgi:hypothetical protein